MSGPRFHERHPAVTGLGVAFAVSAAAIALIVHFVDTENYVGLASVLGALLALIAAAEICVRVAHKRVAGTYSYSFARTERARRERQGRS